MKKNRLLIFVLSLLVPLTMGTSFASSSQNLKNIGDLMNHQNFELAKTEFQKLNLDPYSLSYGDAILYYNVISFNNIEDPKIFLWKYIEKNPKYASGSAVVSRMYGHTSQECIQSNIIEVNDYAEKWFCILFNTNLPNFFKKFSWWQIIVQAKTILAHANNDDRLQFASDIANFISYYEWSISNLSKYQKQYIRNLREYLWNYILRQDKNFINGYFILLNAVNPKDCDAINKIKKNLLDNYKGDKDRLKNSVNDFLDQFKNCN